MKTPAPRLDNASVDDLWEAFVGTLPEVYVDAARVLPVTLCLAPSADVPWSEVFSNAVTLGAPRLVAEAMPGLPAPVVRDASLAHLLAIVEAFGTDRIRDGQIDSGPELDGILALARAARDEALARVSPATLPEESFARADVETAAAIDAEQAVLRSGEAAAWARYLSVTYGKQRLGLPASLALARAAGWDARRRRSLERMLDAVWIGLQLHDDVVDWEEDLSRGGAWATSLAAYAPLRPEAVDVVDARDRKTVPVSARRLVFESGALLRMLRYSTRCFRAARRRAAALGVTGLAVWAREREMAIGELARSEAESPGQTNRAHRLAAWRKTVLGG